MPASRPAREHGLDGGDGLVERLHLVLEVAADDAGRDGPAGGLPRVAVAGLEVHGHRQVHRGDDPADHVQVQVERDVLAVLVAERRRDRVAGGGQGPDAVGPGDHPRGDHVPDVGQHQDLRRRCAGRAGCGRGSARSGMRPNLVRVSEIVRAVSGIVTGRPWRDHLGQANLVAQCLRWSARHAAPPGYRVRRLLPCTCATAPSSPTATSSSRSPTAPAASPTSPGRPVPVAPAGTASSSLRDLVCQHCPVRAERDSECDADAEARPAAGRELGVAGAAR